MAVGECGDLVRHRPEGQPIFRFNQVERRAHVEAADISVAMGSATDLAKTSADAVLLSNRLDSLVQAFSVARRSRHIIIENLTWASLYNGLILPFAAIGWVTPLWAALGMSASSLLVVLNASRSYPKLELQNQTEKSPEGPFDCFAIGAS